LFEEKMMKALPPVFCVLMIVLGIGLIGGAAPQTTILDLAYDVLPAATAAPEPTPALPISTRHTGAGGCAPGRCPYAPVPAESVAKPTIRLPQASESCESGNRPRRPAIRLAGRLLRPVGRVLGAFRLRRR
jgi:hypothetical protein